MKRDCGMGRADARPAAGLACSVGAGDLHRCRGDPVGLGAGRDQARASSSARTAGREVKSRRQMWWRSCGRSIRWLPVKSVHAKPRKVARQKPWLRVRAGPRGPWSRDDALEDQMAGERPRVEGGGSPDRVRDAAGLGRCTS